MRELIEAHASGSHCYLNCVLADGAHAVACRYGSNPDYIDSLYYNRGGSYRCEGEKCWMEHETGEVRAILVSSEPLNQSTQWEPVPRNHMVLIDRDLGLELPPI